jgi:hypothetical protein
MIIYLMMSAARQSSHRRSEGRARLKHWLHDDAKLIRLKPSKPPEKTHGWSTAWDALHVRHNYPEPMKQVIPTLTNQHL